MKTSASSFLGEPMAWTSEVHNRSRDVCACGAMPGKLHMRGTVTCYEAQEMWRIHGRAEQGACTAVARTRRQIRAFGPTPQHTRKDPHVRLRPHDRPSHEVGTLLTALIHRIVQATFEQEGMLWQIRFEYTAVSRQRRHTHPTRHGRTLQSSTERLHDARKLHINPSTH